MSLPPPGQQPDDVACQPHAVHARARPDLIGDVHADGLSARLVAEIDGGHQARQRVHGNRQVNIHQKILNSIDMEYMQEIIEKLFRL